MLPALVDCIKRLQDRNGYSSFSRGVIEGCKTAIVSRLLCLQNCEGEGTSKSIKCDDAFLFAIMEDLDTLALGWLDCIDENEMVDEWHTAFEPVAAELHRLGDNPDLISSQPMRENFFKYVKNFCTFVRQDHPSDDFQQAKQELARSIDTSAQQHYRTTYVENRVPWHQFLHQCGPGLDLDDQDVRDAAQFAGRRQWLSPGASRLHNEWRKDFSQYKKEISGVSSTSYQRLYQADAVSGRGSWAQSELGPIV